MMCVSMESAIASSPIPSTMLSLPLDDAWQWRKCEPGASWEPVVLPHQPGSADLNGQGNWFGTCEYLRSIELPVQVDHDSLSLHVGGAMQRSWVYLDEDCVFQHDGGYLPFEFLIPESFRDGETHLLRLVVDNNYSGDIPPGKPHEELDFCWYGGLYRKVELKQYPAIHITDPLSVDEEAGGGVFLRTLQLDPQGARLGVRTHVRNRYPARHELSLRVRVFGSSTGLMSEGLEAFSLGGETDVHVDLVLAVGGIVPWCVESPALYEVEVEVLDASGAVRDVRTIRYGFREIVFSRNQGLLLNGKRVRPRGTNRHQDYPWVGYALPDAAQYRDALRIKQAGFDYVRLSHYPQSPAFLDACDELGILVMNCIPGWQFIGGEPFREACFRNARQLIRRDRNHPSVVLWELSLNETDMDPAFVSRLHGIGHAEYPGGGMATCGWVEGYDVYLRARQHGQIHTWENGNTALVISEYGDWEYYAENEGFDQATGSHLKPDVCNSRAFRGDGEIKLRQQLLNHAEALDDTLASPALLDGQWAMFDYPRGYHPLRAACGVSDFFRLPKWSYHFYRSQRSIGNPWGDPVLHLATYWSADAVLPVIVLTNLDAVELRLNGSLIACSEGGDRARWPHLPHPPHVFQIDHYEPGLLEATGFFKGEAVATHRVRTPGNPRRLSVRLDDLPAFEGKCEDAYDLLFVHVSLLDEHGTLCVNACADIDLSLDGEAMLAGPSRIRTEAGIASTLVRVPAKGKGYRIIAATLPAACIPSMEVAFEVEAT